jgi:DNA-directed RNA polymerase subunit RPC12/RpoP
MTVRTKHDHLLWLGPICATALAAAIVVVAVLADPGLSGVAGVVVIALAGVIGWLGSAWFVAMHAESKGYSFWGFLVLATLVSWPIALAAALLVSDRASRGPTMNCPECAERILAAARVCRYCGHRLESAMIDPAS